MFVAHLECAASVADIRNPSDEHPVHLERVTAQVNVDTVRIHAVQTLAVALRAERLRRIAEKILNTWMESTPGQTSPNCLDCRIEDEGLEKGDHEQRGFRRVFEPTPRTLSQLSVATREPFFQQT